MNPIRSPYIFTHPWVDSSRAPIYVVTPARTITAEAIETLSRECEASLIKRPHPSGWVTLAGHVGYIDSEARAAVAAMDRRLADMNRRWNVGQAYVLSTQTQRMLLAAIFWLNPPPYPNRTFTNENEAIAWVTGRLNARLASPLRTSQASSSLSATD